MKKAAAAPAAQSEKKALKKAAAAPAAPAMKKARQTETMKAEAAVAPAATAAPATTAAAAADVAAATAASAAAAAPENLLIRGHTELVMAAGRLMARLRLRINMLVRGRSPRTTPLRQMDLGMAVGLRRRRRKRRSNRKRGSNT